MPMHIDVTFDTAQGSVDMGLNVWMQTYNKALHKCSKCHYKHHNIIEGKFFDMALLSDKMTCHSQ